MQLIRNRISLHTSKLLKHLTYSISNSSKAKTLTRLKQYTSISVPFNECKYTKNKSKNISRISINECSAWKVLGKCLLKDNSLPVSEQLQVKLLIPSRHCPPFRHGFEIHSFLFISQSIPANPFQKVIQNHLFRTDKDKSYLLYVFNSLWSNISNVLQMAWMASHFNTMFLVFPASKVNNIKFTVMEPYNLLH